MLVHQHQDSEGTVGTTVNITDRTVSNSRPFDSPCHSGISLGTNGVLSTFQADGGLSVVQGEWLVSGNPTTLFAQRTLISGDLQVDPGTGFLQLNVSRNYDNQRVTEGVKTTVVFFEIADDALGTTIFDTATMTFISEQGTI